MENEKKLMETLPAEITEIAQKVSVEKRNEVQNVLNFVFNGVAKMREQLDNINVVDENDNVNMKLANTIRLGVKKIRLDAEKTFDGKRTEVQRLMIGYKTEDLLWLKAKQTMQILTKEIEENAKWKEETKKRIDAERLELKIQQRINRIFKIAPEMLRSEFENMSDSAFELFFSSIEKEYNNKIEAELKAEKERIQKEKEAAEEKARMLAENEKLKAEKEANELKLKAEKEANEKLQAEIKAKKEAEEKTITELKLKELAEIKAKELAEKEAKTKPDKIKLFEFAEFVENIIFPEVANEQAKKILTDTKILLNKTSNFIKEKSSKI